MGTCDRINSTEIRSCLPKGRKAKCPKKVVIERQPLRYMESNFNAIKALFSFVFRLKIS